MAVFSTRLLLSCLLIVVAFTACIGQYSPYRSHRRGNRRHRHPYTTSSIGTLPSDNPAENQQIHKPQTVFPDHYPESGARVEDRIPAFQFDMDMDTERKPPSSSHFKPGQMFPKSENVVTGIALVPSMDPTSERPMMNGVCSGSNSRLYVRRSLCYTAGTKGPCHGNMVFTSNSDNLTGTCDCPQRLPPSFRYLLYYPPNDDCYPILSQGPCEDGEWLVLNRKGVAECTVRVCPENSSENEKVDKVYFQRGSLCYQTNTRADCSNKEHEAAFVINEPEPMCVKVLEANTRYITQYIPPLQCAPGHKRVTGGACKKTATFSP